MFCPPLPGATVTSVIAAPQRVVAITDARTGAAQLVNDRAVATGRRAGHYVALCGTRVLAASLTVPPVRSCRRCAAGVLR